MYQYSPKYRPPAFSSLPEGYELLEAPQVGGYNRPDLPASSHRFGMIGLPTKLSAEDAERYELTYVGKTDD